MNKYLFIVLLLFFSTDLRAQLQFGYVDYDAVLQNIPEAGLLNERIEKYGQSLVSETDSLENLLNSVIQEMQAMEEDVQSLGTNGPERAKYYTLQTRLNNLAESLETKKIELDQRYQQRQAQLLEPFYNKLYRAMDEIALENGIQVLLDPTITPESFKKALESESIIDLTEQLTQRLLEYE